MLIWVDADLHARTQLRLRPLKRGAGQSGGVALTKNILVHTSTGMGTGIHCAPPVMLWVWTLPGKPWGR